jgi:hypothetical protein
VAKCSWGKENIDITGNSTHSGLSNVSTTLYSNQNTSNPNVISGIQTSTVWPTVPQAVSSNSGWTQANYQWPAGYHPNTMIYWQGYTANAAAYQNAINMQGWGVMPTPNISGATVSSNLQYAPSMTQFQQNSNGKSS